MTTTTIQISLWSWQRIQNLKKNPGDSFNKILARSLTLLEKELGIETPPEPEDKVKKMLSAIRR
jgi:hypothetical protein